MGRLGTVKEVGSLAIYIAADATFTTGADFPITGGAELSFGEKARLKPQMPY